nr:Dihydrofolate reductase [uncultured bacterium]
MVDMVSIIAAIDDKRGIGKNGSLLFRIKEDMQRLRKITDGHPLVMGRKTFDSFPGLLPNRTHIVITRDPKAYHPEEVSPHVVVSSLEDGIAAAKNAAGADEIFIFGGGQIFTEAIEKGLVDRLYLTIVKGDYSADTFFPEYGQFTKVIEKIDRDVDGYQYSFLTLEK